MGLKIIVCVKQVLDTAAKIRIKNGSVETDGVARILNPYDEFAVEEAVRIKEKNPDAEITALTLGPEGFRDTLRTALAMGADAAAHLCDPAFADLDPGGVALALALAIRQMPFDLILCGRQAVDDDMAHLGPALAVHLNIPCVTVVTRLQLDLAARTAEATRQIEGGAEILTAPLPALFTCQKGLNQPRLPSLKGIMRAKKAEIKTLGAQTLGFDPAGAGASKTQITGLYPPPERKKGALLSGTPAETAAQLAHILHHSVKVI